MKRNKLVLTILPMLLFSSCTNGNVNYSASFKDELSNLKNGPWITSSEITDYELKHTEKLTSNNQYLYTIRIDYKNRTLNNFRVIVLPSGNIEDNMYTNLATVGYYTTMNLVPTRTDENDKSNYPQYKLQVEKAKKQTYLYVSVAYNETQELIRIVF